MKKDRSERGEMIQASYRSSAAILGMAFYFVFLVVLIKFLDLKVFE